MSVVPRVVHGLACTLALCMAFASTEARTMVARQSIAELQASSDLIVTGRVAAAAPGPVHDVPGKDVVPLVIDRVIAGKVDGDTVPLAVPAQGGPIGSDDIPYVEGTSGLWFLRALPTPSGRVYLADTPQRFVPAAEMDETMRALGALRD